MSPSRVVLHEGNPYVGLRPFFRADNPVFFGRRAQTQDLLLSLHAHHFLAVVGSSGSGKSSLVRAGLIPALVGGFLVEHRDRWKTATFKPSDKPLQMLARGLLHIEGVSDDDLQEIKDFEAAIRSDHVEAVLDRVLPSLGDDTNLLCVVDQFEEIFAFRGADDDDESVARMNAEQLRKRAERRSEAAAFVDLIIALGRRRDVPVYVVLTMRTDFLGDCDLFYGLPEAMNRGRYLVPRLTRTELREAVLGPARLSGTTIAPRLLDRILNTLGDRKDRLPVLQHALFRTWDCWHERGAQGDIDFEDFDAAGGLESALEKDAEAALEGCDAEHAMRIFRCLTDTDYRGRPIRRPATITKLAAMTGLSKEGVLHVLERFREKGRNFVYFSYGSEAEGDRVDVSHESLIRRWGRLRDWVEQERDSRDRFHALLDRHDRWAAGKAALLRDVELSVTREWYERERPRPEWASKYGHARERWSEGDAFLTRSRKKQLQRKLFVTVLVGSVITVLSGLSWVAWRERSAAADSAAKARASAEEAEEHAADFYKQDLLERARAKLGERQSDVAGRIVLELENEQSYEVATQKLKSASTAVESEAVAIMRAVLQRGLSARLATTLRGALTRVLDADVAAGGKHVVTASVDGSATLWSVPDGGAALATVGDGKKPIVDVACHPKDAMRFATTDRERAVLWQLEAGTARATSIVLTLPPEDDGGAPRTQGEFWCLAFSPDGQYLATGGARGVVLVWNAATGRVERTSPEPHEGALTSLSFSPDSQALLAASADGTASLWWKWREDDAKRVVLEGHRSPVVSAVFSPDAEKKWILTASWDGTARLWSRDLLLQASPATATHVLPDSAPLAGAEFSPDGQYVLSFGDSTRARIWQARTGDELKLESIDHDAAVVAASFTPGGAAILTASADGTSRITWRKTPKQARHSVRLDDGKDPIVVARCGSSELGPLLLTAPGHVSRGDTKYHARLWQPMRSVDFAQLEELKSSFMKIGGRNLTDEERDRYTR